MKLATVIGASFSKSLQARRPMVVSMTAVGPVGTTGGLIWVVVLGASGSCWGGGGDCSGAVGGGVGCGWGCGGGREAAGRVGSIVRVQWAAGRVEWIVLARKR